MCIKRQYDISSGKVEIEIVKLAALKDKNAREIGSEWLRKQAFDQLGIGDFLEDQCWEVEKISLAVTHITKQGLIPGLRVEDSIIYKRELSCLRDYRKRQE